MQPLPSAPPPASTTTTSDDRSSEFRAVQGGPQLRSGELLLVEAYAAIWLILFGFLWLTFHRQRKIDARMLELENAVHKARKEAP